MKLYTPKDNAAGLFCLHFKGFKNEYNIHFLIRKQYRFFGRSGDFDIGPVYIYGFGPFFCIVISGKTT